MGRYAWQIILSTTIRYCEVSSMSEDIFKKHIKRTISNLAWVIELALSFFVGFFVVAIVTQASSRLIVFESIVLAVLLIVQLLVIPHLKRRYMEQDEGDLAAITLLRYLSLAEQHKREQLVRDVHYFILGYLLGMLTWIYLSG